MSENLCVSEETIKTETQKDKNLSHKDMGAGGEQDLGQDGKQNPSAKERARAFFASAWEYVKFAKIELIIICMAVFLDLLTKFLIDKTMNQYEVNVLIKNFLQFRYVFNENAAFGSAFGLDSFLGEQGIRIFFVVFSIITICVFCYMMYHNRNRGLFVRISFAVVIGGAFGNLYDRIAFGYVRDFVEIVFFGYDVPLVGPTFAIFNIADAALVIGMIMLLIFFIFKYNPDEPKLAKETETNNNQESISTENLNNNETMLSPSDNDTTIKPIDKDSTINPSDNDTTAPNGSQPKGL